jgi:hypothetical protein
LIGHATALQRIAASLPSSFQSEQEPARFSKLIGKLKYCVFGTKRKLRLKYTACQKKFKVKSLKLQELQNLGHKTS